MSGKRVKIILDMVATDPMRVTSIAIQCGVTEQTIGQTMRRIHRAGLVHIAKREGYQQTAYYLAGPGEDAPKVTLRESIPQLIAETAMSADEIAQIVGATESSVRVVMWKMQREGIPMHIKRWKRSTRGPMKPLWIMGEGKDAAKPTKYTPAQKCKRWRKTKEGSERRKEYARHYHSKVASQKAYAAKGVAGIDPLLAAIMGV